MRPVVCGLVLFVQVLLSGPSASALQSAPTPIRILILYAHPPEAASVNAFTNSLRTTIRNSLDRPVEFHEEVLNPDPSSSPERWPQLARYVAVKYRDLTIDAVVAEGSVALRFAAENLHEVLPDAPIVFGLAVESVANLKSIPPNLTGRWVPMPYAATLALARKLQPNAERVVIVGGVMDHDSLAGMNAAREIASSRGSLQVDVWNGVSNEELLTRLRELRPRSIVILATPRRGANGMSFMPAQTISAISKASAAPVYGILHNWVGNGIVGGAVIDFGAEGERVGDLVVHLLERSSGEALPPIRVGTTPYVVDWRELRRWGLSRDLLPAGTEIQYRMNTPWEQYRAPMFVIFGLIAGQSILIGLLLIERKRRIRAQRSVEEQAAYEQTIAELTTDAVRHAPEESPRALEDALERVGRYARAQSVILVHYDAYPSGKSRRLSWQRTPGNWDSAAANGSSNGSHLEIPLVVDGATIGALELHRPNREGWSTNMVARLESAGELIAGALARSRATQAVTRGEELNRAVLASVSTQIAILDRDGTIIRVNEAWRDLARRAGVESHRGGFVGSNYLDECRRAETRGCDEAHDVRLGIEAVLQRERWPFRYEYRWSTPEERWYELCVDRLQTIDGGAIVSHLDITDRRLAELRAEETKRQIAHMGRVAMIGELTAAISHELNQPLAAIRANAQAGALLLRKTPPDLSEIRNIFQDIVSDNVRASEVIAHVRMLLRKDRPATTTIDLNEICEHAVQLLRRDAGLRGARLELELEPELPPASGDAVQLQQVVLNLTLNALDSVAASAGDREVVVGTAAHDDEVEVYVRDTGIGLPANVQEHLFESFFSTKAQGLGMGLVIVRSIVERHNGRVRAENDASGGAVFRVLLPVEAWAVAKR